MMNPDELAKRTLGHLREVNPYLIEWKQNGFIRLADGTRVYPVLAPSETPDLKGEFTPILLTGMEIGDL